MPPKRAAAALPSRKAADAPATKATGKAPAKKAATNGAKEAAPKKEPAKRGRPAKPQADEKVKAPAKAAKADKKAESASPPPAESQESQTSKASKSSTKSKTTMAKSNKRKASSEPEAPVAKKVRASALLKDDEKNVVPTQRMHIYVFGEGSSGELGLGTAKNAIDVKRPRLNPLLPADSVGVVRIAAGGMHVIALTHDNKLLTWGVNDQGSLGRDTAWEGGLVDIDDNKSDDSSDSGDDTGMNPREATPTAIPEDAFPEGTKFVEVAAADSASFALTDDGLVYGWGTFRSNEGIFGFSKTSVVQKTPVLIPELKKIRHIAAGANHILALDASGNVFAWGSGQQNQLGRRVVERTKIEGLVPREFGLPRRQITQIACGSYHSFAMDKKGNVWAWGLNNFGETGIPEHAGEDDAVILKPAKVENLAGKNMKMLYGGGHHSVGVTEGGECLVWGRLDGFQMGIPMETLKALPEEQVKRDEHGRARILKVPTAVPGIDAVYACCGFDHTIAITREGRAYSWGFSANYQTGQGTDDDIEVATLIDNTAVREKKLCFADAGGQYSILAAPAEGAAPTTNGTA
ncbi:uncharacterized protein K452DRAFT_284531 [Aplosporella prunicola CBS 121167]|uniref:RCC1-like domain-containing protein n=1 Tax=Aplosporella prunicola CBS 121167 TaxID=1176127 RepID=A0A6A6BM03_9PEZI|nr:uncharacterized protein K452DRAFT_284531 [Aplosporella prunicola CBS 121167]KAF2145142.1 hypothetical protein K452DRAFT_284531 [Aplosporella prunicola CBS 121167]